MDKPHTSFFLENSNSHIAIYEGVIVKTDLIVSGNSLIPQSELIYYRCPSAANRIIESLEDSL